MIAPVESARCEPVVMLAGHRLLSAGTLRSMSLRVAGLGLAVRARGTLVSRRDRAGCSGVGAWCGCSRRSSSSAAWRAASRWGW